jgi:hypothetical protein
MLKTKRWNNIIEIAGSGWQNTSATAYTIMNYTFWMKYIQI